MTTSTLDEHRPPPPLLDRTDAALIVLITAIGMGLRLAWFSGYGLGDDILIRHATSWFLESGLAPGANYGYRFAWWGPTMVAGLFLGTSEWALVLPTVVAAAAALTLMYATGAALWGRPGGILAATLLTVMPIDFAWSTMVTPDILSSAFMLACMLALFRAPVATGSASRRRLLATAAVMAWLSFHVKVSAGLMGLPILVTFWLHRQALGRDLLVFFGVAALLFGMTAFTSFAITGDPFLPYTSEILAQGLTGPDAAHWHALSWPVFMHFPRAVFVSDQYGNMLFGGLPPLLLVVGVLGPLFGFRLRAPEVWSWLVVLAIGLQFNFQLAEGVWVAGFRNIRHVHGIVHPLVLLTAGTLVVLRRRSPTAFGGALVAILGVGLWHSLATATLTHVSFADRRAACRDLLGRPPKVVYSDFQIDTGCSIEPGGVELDIKEVPSLPSEERTRMIAAAGDVYVVTGGGREPHYGCVDCVPLARELDPDDWTLLFEGPPGPAPNRWRAEPIRVWERRRAPS